MGRINLLSAIFALSLSISASPAQAIPLELPIDCEPGTDCWIVHHVDRDPATDVMDHRCGRLTYDGHDGVDFAIPNLRVMAKGVPVLAAAAGKVRGVRNDEPDQRVEERGKDAVRGRECGNGVAIVHSDGLETQYCHLRQGSIVVRPGQMVEAGSVLGLVGLSGETSFPHLHFTTRRDGKALDPFTGDKASQKSCSLEQVTGLWSGETSRRLRHRPIPITGLGVSPSLADATAIRRGDLDGVRPRSDAEALIVWMQAYKLEKDDRIELQLLDPDGRIVHRNEVVQSKPQALVMLWSGQKRRAARWQIGEWTARATISRGATVVSEERRVSVEP